MPSIDLVCDYVISRLTSGGVRLNLLKLQKLMYYIQAWHLAFFRHTLFSGRFQAWIHGPVNRHLYDRFSSGDSSRSLYSEIDQQAISRDYSSSQLGEQARGHIDSVLEVYAPFTGTQLEELTHRERPWVEARGGRPDNARCETEISEQTMGDFYRARIESSNG